MNQFPRALSFCPEFVSQQPRCKQRGVKLAALQSSGVFDPRGSRQMCMQACPLGSLPAGIKKANGGHKFVTDLPRRFIQARRPRISIRLNHKQRIKIRLQMREHHEL